MNPGVLNPRDAFPSIFQALRTPEIAPLKYAAERRGEN
jgi:hypothetical protein